MLQFKNSKDKAKFVHKLFSRIAPYYDMMNSIISFRRDAYWRRVAVSKLQPKPEQYILDVACGTGKLTVEILRQEPNARVQGLDFNPDMLAIGRKEMQRLALDDRVNMQEADAMAMPYADNTFDGAISAFALRNVPDVPTVLREMHRVVKPGGRVVNLELAKPSLPVFKQLYNFYFGKLMPRIAKLAGGDSSYLWLHDSWRQFYHQENLRKEFIKAGFAEADYQELTGGVVAVHYGVVKK